MPYKDLVVRREYQKDYRKSFRGHAIRMWGALKLRTKLNIVPTWPEDSGLRERSRS